MKLKCYYYIVEDSHGHICSAVCESPSDVVQIYGIHDKDDQPIYFESDAYHIPSLCGQNGLKYQSGEHEFDVAINTKQHGE